MQTMAKFAKTPKTVIIQTRVNAQAKAEAEKILAQLGMTLDDLFNQSLFQVQTQKRPPAGFDSWDAFEESVLRTHAEYESGKLKPFKSVADMFAELDAEDDEDE